MANSKYWRQENDNWINLQTTNQHRKREYDLTKVREHGEVAHWTTQAKSRTHISNTCNDGCDSCFKIKIIKGNQEQ